MLIAKLLGAVYLAVGVGMAFNNKFYESMVDDFMKNKAMMYLGGAMALAVGVLITSFHNVWEDFATIVISLIGWIAVVKGVFILVLPEVMMDMTKKIWSKSLMQVATLVAVVLGAYFWRKVGS